MIVMIVPDITNPFFPGAVRGAEDIAFQNGFRLVLCNSDNSFAKESTYIREMQTYRPSGLIVVPSDLSRSADEARAYIEDGACVIFVDRIPAKWKGDSVTSDMKKARSPRPVILSTLAINGSPRLPVPAQRPV